MIDPSRQYDLDYGPRSEISTMPIEREYPPRAIRLFAKELQQLRALRKVGRDVPIAPFQLFERWKIRRRDGDIAPYHFRAPVIGFILAAEVFTSIMRRCLTLS